MARIRTIKPEFPQSETMGRLSRDARLLFVQLWTISDDQGRSRASSRMLASLLYPYDDDARGLIDGWLSELEQQNCIRRYEVEGATFLEIVNWLKHQKIDHPSKSRLPEFREASRSLAPDLGPRTSTKDLSIAPSARVKTDFSKTFLEFYLAYPKRKSKKDAEKAYIAARKDVSHETIMEGLRRAIASDPRFRDPQFTPYPASWLRAGGYEDQANVVPLKLEAWS